MRRATASGLIGLAILLCTASPASAQWRIIRWLEQLSGPGPFTFPYAASLSFGCQGKDGKAFDMKKWENWTICDQNPAPVGDSRAWKQVRNYWTVTAGKGSGANTLDYPAGQKKETVSAWLLNVGPAYRASPVTDIGATIGIVHFSGSTEKSFNALALDGYLVLRPFAATNKKWGQVFAIHLDTTYFPQGFNLADFGAIGGTGLDGKAELISSVVFEVNLLHFGKR